MGVKKRHHVVSRGYQRFFGENDRVQILIKTTNVTKPVSTRDCCVVDHFNSLMTPQGAVTVLEEMWEEIETTNISLVRELIEFGEDSSKNMHAVRSLAALHFARSFGLSSTVVKGLLAQGPDTARQIANDPHTISLFQQQYGREPNGEIEQYVRKQIELMDTTRWWVVNRMWHYYELVLQFLESRHMQFIVSEPHGVRFISGDAPFVISRYGGLQIGVENGLAVHEATDVYFPLSPDLAVKFTLNPENALGASEIQTKQLNNLVYRSSKFLVFGHPSQKLHHAAALPK